MVSQRSRPGLSTVWDTMWFWTKPVAFSRANIASNSAWGGARSDSQSRASAPVNRPTASPTGITTPSRT